MSIPRAFALVLATTLATLTGSVADYLAERARGKRRDAERDEHTAGQIRALATVLSSEVPTAPAATLPAETVDDYTDPDAATAPPAAPTVTFQQPTPAAPTPSPVPTPEPGIDEDPEA